jgi:hypothetical protein
LDSPSGPNVPIGGYALIAADGFPEAAAALVELMRVDCGGKLEQALEFQVHRRQLFHEPKMQSLQQYTSGTSSSSNRVAGEVGKVVEQLHQHPQKQLQQWRPRAKLSAAIRQVLKADRRRQRREEGFAAIAASQGVWRSSSPQSIVQLIGPSNPSDSALPPLVVLSPPSALPPI